MARALGLANLLDHQVGGRRNIIINGAMEVWQRGTSQTTSGSYVADRFWMANASSAARDTDAPSGFTYSTKLTYSASNMAFGQPIELPATGEQGQFVAGSVVTLSYYAKVDTGTEDITAVINFRESKFSGTNQSSFTSSNSSATWTTTWTRYTHSFTIPTINSTNTVAALEIGGIGRDAYITGVQLELGETATPFEHRSYGEELALCQRYYFRPTGNVSTDGSVGYKYVSPAPNGSFSFNGTFTFPVKMRAHPSAYEITAPTYNNCSSITFNTRADGYLCRVEVTNSGNYRAYDWLYEFDAEL